MIELQGNWLMFDGRRLVELPADLRSDIRARFEDYLNTPLEQTWLDIDKTEWSRVLMKDDQILGSYPDDHRGQPPLPDGCEVVEVVKMDDLKTALDNANIGFDF